jgi:hypothetical protein
MSDNKISHSLSSTHRMVFVMGPEGPVEVSAANASDLIRFGDGYSIMPEDRAPKEIVEEPVVAEPETKVKASMDAETPKTAEPKANAQNPVTEEITKPAAKRGRPSKSAGA